jgi:hypothetical protein
MTVINLSDLAAATSAYIDSEVDVTVTNVTDHLQPGELGTYTVHVTNASAPTGVRLTDLTLHLTTTPVGKVKLLAPGSALLIPRATGDKNDPRLPRNDERDSMFIFFAADDGDIEPNATLDVGEQIDLEFEYKANRAGEDVTINCHVHATVDVDSLFPRSGGNVGTSEEFDVDPA